MGQLRGTESCMPNRMSKAICSTGGFEGGCHVYQSSSHATCTQDLGNRNLKNFAFESYGAHSRCTMLSLRNGMDAACLRMRCNAAGNVEMLFADEVFTCPKAGKFKVNLKVYSGEVECPEVEEICENSLEKRCDMDCSGNGYCMADRTCQCIHGFTGSACNNGNKKNESDFVQGYRYDPNGSEDDKEDEEKEEEDKDDENKEDEDKEEEDDEEENDKKTWKEFADKLVELKPVEQKHDEAMIAIWKAWIKKFNLTQADEHTETNINEGEIAQLEESYQSNLKIIQENREKRHEILSYIGRNIIEEDMQKLKNYIKTTTRKRTNNVRIKNRSFVRKFRKEFQKGRVDRKISRMVQNIDSRILPLVDQDYQDFVRDAIEGMVSIQEWKSSVISKLRNIFSEKKWMIETGDNGELDGDYCDRTDATCIKSINYESEIRSEMNEEKNEQAELINAIEEAYGSKDKETLVDKLN